MRESQGVRLLEKVGCHSYTKYLLHKTHPPRGLGTGERAEHCFSNTQVKSLPWGWEKARMSLLWTAKGREGQRKNIGESSWDILQEWGWRLPPAPPLLPPTSPSQHEHTGVGQRVCGCLAAQAGCCSPWFLTASRSDLELQRADTISSNSCIF